MSLHLKITLLVVFVFCVSINNGFICSASVHGNQNPKKLRARRMKINHPRHIIIEFPPSRNPKRPRLPPSAACGCTSSYFPVCGQKMNHVKTFANECRAICAKFNILYEGPCAIESPGSVDDQQVIPKEVECICGKNLDPVCAKLKGGDEKRTFDNQCLANCNEAFILHDGTCDSEE